MLTDQMEEEQMIILKNNGKQREAILLLQFRNLVVTQLFLIKQTLITKNIFDGVHYTMLVRAQNKVIGGLCYYQINIHKCVNIIYFVVHPDYQAKGYGTKLLINFKEQMRKKGIDTIVTQADIISLNFYFKNGFIQFQKKKRGIDRQPATNEQINDKDQEEQNMENKFKQYQPWIQYIEDYYSSLLVVCKIGQKINYRNFGQIVRNQKQQLINRLDGKNFRGLPFKRDQMEKLILQHRQKYEAEHGVLITSQKLKKLREKIRAQQKQVTTNEKIITKMQQLALLDILKSHSTSWVLKLKFIKIPEAYNSALSNIITIHQIQQRIVNNQYKASQEMCADLTKLFENLKLFLAESSNYYQACSSLQQYMQPFIEQICTGTFNAKKYYQQKQNKQN